MGVGGHPALTQQAGRLATLPPDGLRAASLITIPTRDPFGSNLAQNELTLSFFQIYTSHTQACDPACLPSAAVVICVYRTPPS